MYQHRQVELMARRIKALAQEIRLEKQKNGWTDRSPAQVAAWKWLDLALLWALRHKSSYLALLIISEERDIMGIAA